VSEGRYAGEKRFMVRGRRAEGYAWVRPRVLESVHKEFADGYFGRLLYRLPDVLRAVAFSDDIYWCEGEKDANALCGLGEVATTHWQGAGNCTAEQADTFRGHEGRLLIVADLDAAGAYCAARRRRLALARMVAPGLAMGRVVVLAPAVGADLSDHVAAGLGVDELREADIPAMLALAKTYTRSAQRDYAG
jgi:hypothetical protein